MLKDKMSTEEKASAFDMILKVYSKNNGFYELGSEVEKILKFLIKFFDYRN